MFQTQQEEFWSGNFGNDYTNRNQGEQLKASNLALFSKILFSAHDVQSVIEFGPNMGLNLQSLQLLLPKATFAGVEINYLAAERLKALPNINVVCDSILNFKPNQSFDFVLSKGLLIHINPDFLDHAYDVLYKTSKKYICLVEYYNPVPVKISYRGNEDKLFKRDFAGELLDKYSDLTLVDYGFSYHRDKNFAQDDVSWFLLKKK